jgi:hypothetical protein
MGRDAWIEGKKQELIRKIQDDLQHNRINEAFLRNQIDSGMIGIEEKNYLQHEVLVENQDTHAQIQQIVDTFFNAPQGSRDRDQVVVNLKNALQQHYPKTTTSLDQLERALLQLEQAKLQSEVEVIVSKLNILDIGRINQGGGKRVHGFLVSAADSIAKSIQNSNFLSQSAKEVL